MNLGVPCMTAGRVFRDSAIATLLHTLAHGCAYRNDSRNMITYRIF